MIDELLDTCYHEGGHAVTAAAQGVRVYSATVEPDGTTLGHVRYANCRSHPVMQASILLAGGLAVNE